MARGRGRPPRGSSTPADWWFILDEFLDRAGRVLSSEIARRDDLATVGSTMKVVAAVTAGATHYRLERQRPPVADIEAAVSRVRPLFAEDDLVFHRTVTGALGALAQHAPQDTKNQVRELGAAWRAHETSVRWGMASSLSPLPDDQRWRNDRQIARDFIYGDLLHADPEARRRLRGIPEDERLPAAAVWVADATRLTLATKQLILELRDAGLLTPRP
jgi:hypothetical protein